MSSGGRSDNGQAEPGLSAPASDSGGRRADGEQAGSPAQPGVAAVVPVVLVLGAGLARRFGADKLAARLPDGREVGAVTLDRARTAWPRVACVVRPGTRMAELAAAAGVQVIECPEAVDGMGHSLAAGVRATSEAGGWIVMLGDMPRVQPATVRAIARALQAGATVAIPRHHGRRGHPVGLNRCLGRRLAELRGDEGARSIVAALAGGVVELDVDDAGVLADIDTPADLAAGDPAAT